ncbi:MAG TPA: hypothetical protein VGH28_19350 [Polyangiaceae bacterium]|jgi:hypothetical protein
MTFLTRRSVATFALLGFSLAASACSSGGGLAPDDAGADVVDIDVSTPLDDGGAADVNNGAPSDAYPAPHPAYPTISSEGTIIASPKLLPVFFTADPSMANLTTFVQTLGASAYWKSAVNEYGVGPVVARDAVVVDPSELGADAGATLAPKDLEQFVISHLDGTHAGWGAPDSSTVYVLFLPASVQVSDGNFGVSCKNIGGYHDSVAIGAVNVAFAVIPRCASFGSMQGDDVTTSSTSHEMVEAVTDPFSTQNLYGYSDVDQNHIIYSFQPLTELGDMCAQEGDSYFKPTDFPFMVQRIWSNAAAAAGRAPCQPQPAGNVYYAAVPVLPSATLTYGGYSLPTTGITVPIGTSATFDLDLVSDGPTNGPINVMVLDAAQLSGGSPDVTYTLDRSSGYNGEILHATATRKKAGTYGGSEFWVLAATNVNDTSTYHFFFGFAANK